MNICFVNSTGKWGGVKSWTIDVAQGLSERGHTITIIGRPGAFIDKARDLGLATVATSFGPDFNPIIIGKFARLFIHNKIDVIIVNVGKDIRTAGLAGKILNIPVIHRIGLSGDMENTFKIRLVHKLINPKFLVPCEKIKDGLIERLCYIKKSDVKCIITGKKRSPRITEIVHRPLRFITTSQLNKDKGHIDVLHAFSELNAAGYEFEYHVVGTGSYENQLKATASRLGIAEHVIWHGFQSHVRQHLAKSDVFLLPSYSEGLPNSLLEAMSEGLICISRNVGGVEEAWPDDRTNLLKYNADSSDFSEKIRNIIQLDNDRLADLKMMFWENTPSHSKMLDEIDNYLTLICNNG